MAEDLQAFRSHAPLWVDGEQTTEHRGGTATSQRSSTISWPLTSFANTIQNVCCISLILGFLLALNLVALCLRPSNSPWTPLNIYFLFLLLFHLLEFLTTAIFNPSRVTVDSFLLNNGASYWYAQIFCVVEYVMREKYFRDNVIGSALRVIDWRVLRSVGIGMTVCGQVVRTLAMVTAAQSFNHQVSTHVSKQPDHILVTHGIYRFLRHPSYFGFFWWSIGLQLFLNNSLAAVLFTNVLWSFFHRRIQTEELHLIKFFGKPYADYRAATPTRIPFIK